MLSLVHKDESIIPAGPAAGLRSLVSGGSGGGDIHVHYNVGGVNALDARGVEAVLDRHADKIVSILARQHREFRLAGKFRF